MTGSDNLGYCYGGSLWMELVVGYVQAYERHIQADSFGEGDDALISNLDAFQVKMIENTVWLGQKWEEAFAD